MELRIRTLTPLWTGGVIAGQMDRIHEAGIIGSLRWWFEVFLRGLGGLVTDPTESERSAFDQETYERSNARGERLRLRDAGLCDVSQVFGATGWRRRFRLVIQDNTTPDSGVLSKSQAARSYTFDGQNRTPTWRFPENLQDKPRSGQLSFHIQSLASDFNADMVAGLLQFVADWAAIGARAQMGFGLIEPMNGPVNTQPLYDWLTAVGGTRHYPELPSLKNIFLARVCKPNATSQETFNVKYDLRQLFRNDKELRHFIMGTVHGGRMAAKIKISRPYGDGLIRVWGWIPEEAVAYLSHWNRQTVLDAIYQHLKRTYDLQVWREMNSSRDSVVPKLSDAPRFLRDLFGLPEVV